MPLADHSAAHPAAGFEHQRQLALVLLCEAYARDPSVKVRLEAVEDIDVVSDIASIDTRVQVKHHLDDHVLGDLTPELWRALNVWMDLVEAAGAEPLARLHLATTSVARPGSAVALLGTKDRNVQEAAQRLLDATEESVDVSTREARDRFARMGQAARERLLSAVTVLDSTVQVTGLHERLLSALGLVVPSENAGAFLERLQGWWVGRSVQLLAGERAFVSGADLYRYCDALRDEFRRGDLPVTEELFTDPDEEQKAPLQDRVFVRQLKMVMATSETLDLAVRHYYRAFAQRGSGEAGHDRARSAPAARDGPGAC
jgi:hypothetical protein